MRQLLDQLSISRQRKVVAVQGSVDWCDQALQSLASQGLSSCVFSDRLLVGDAIPFARAETCLGSEAELVVVDLFGGFNPDLLCIACGLVSAGGVLLLLSPPLSDWDLEADTGAIWQDQTRSCRARFVEYFFDRLAIDQKAGYRLTAMPAANRRRFAGIAEDSH